MCEELSTLLASVVVIRFALAANVEQRGRLNDRRREMGFRFAGDYFAGIEHLVAKNEPRFKNGDPPVTWDLDD